jgi:hypothetical protein
MQGSVLDHNLFLMCVNDITVASKDTVSIKPFVDDVKLNSIIDFDGSTVSLQQRHLLCPLLYLIIVFIIIYIFNCMFYRQFNQ